MIEELNLIAGIGPKLAQKLTKYIKKGENVRAALRKSEIFKDLPIITRYDLLYNPSRAIPRRVITRFKNILKQRLPFKHDICGSYRRGKEISTDIDLITTAADWDSFQTYAKLKSPKIYANGKFKTSVLFKIPNYAPYVKLDVFYADKDNYLFMKLFATGSGQFNVFMRWRAQQCGYKLNQNGLYKNGKKINVKTLKKLFKMIKTKYIPPQRRSSKYSKTWL